MKHQVKTKDETSVSDGASMVFNGSLSSISGLADDQPISRRQGRGDCPERPGYLQHALLIPQMGSGFPRKVCLNVQDWGQVCRFQGKNRGGFGSGPLLVNPLACSLRMDRSFSMNKNTFVEGSREDGSEASAGSSRRIGSRRYRGDG